MKKLLTALSTVAVLTSAATAANQLTVTAEVASFATVSFGTATGALTGENNAVDHIINIGNGPQAPADFSSQDTAVYAITNDPMADITMTLTGASVITRVGGTETIPVQFGYTPDVSGSVEPNIALDGSQVIALTHGTGNINQSDLVGVLTVTPTVAATQTAGSYTGVYSVTISAT